MGEYLKVVIQSSAVLRSAASILYVQGTKALPLSERLAHTCMSSPEIVQILS